MSLHLKTNGLVGTVLCGAVAMGDSKIKRMHLPMMDTPSKANLPTRVGPSD